MHPISHIPSVLHGGDENLNNTLARLSWKEIVLGIGIVLGIFILILLIALITE